MLLNNNIMNLFVILTSTGEVKLRGETSQWEFLQANMNEGDTYYWGCETAKEYNKDWLGIDATPNELTDEEIDELRLQKIAEKNGITIEELKNTLQNRV